MRCRRDDDRHPSVERQFGQCPRIVLSAPGARRVGAAGAGAEPEAEANEGTRKASSEARVTGRSPATTDRDAAMLVRHAAISLRDSVA